ncbi:glutamate cyclase domain-containing protein [uncultured Fretibacterium sp.]|uniref:glutamate cyclase domain-containing protein n=1 Tax=uncultured Fretibacterium sp. TaxID=1678694 RepID=UPI002611D01D|nr:glutamate cyclase domain-containing protein [uncultured Fretibacterium sp.]
MCAGEGAACRGLDVAALLRIVASDLGGRKVPALSHPSGWEEALALCLAAEGVTIVTGFFIASAGAPETDGPAGSVALGRAMELLGRRVQLVTDSRNSLVLSACSAALGGPPVAAMDGPHPAALEGADLLIFLERPGCAGDGRYYNMRGNDISASVVPLDDLAVRALEHGLPVIGIGDGGNEAGMGALYEPLKRLLPEYARCLSRVPATVCLPVDVSNWGGYALAALLSAASGRWVGLSPGEEERALRAAVGAGAVDGTTGCRTLSVDGFSLERLERVTVQLKDWYGIAAEKTFLKRQNHA